MRILKLVALFFLFYLNTYSQTQQQMQTYYSSLYTQNTNWDWTNPLDYPTYFYINGLQPIICVFPFSDANLGVVTAYQDYKPEDGWVLIFRDFGSVTMPVKMPYFVLYNKYNGTFRIFTFIVTLENYTRISVQTTYEINGNANLAYTTSPAYALSSKSNYETNSNIGFVQGSNAQWIYNDIALAYDPNTPTYEHLSFIFDIKGIGINNISLDGTILLEQKVQANLGQNNKNILAVIEGAGKALGEKYDSFTNAKNKAKGAVTDASVFFDSLGHKGHPNNQNQTLVNIGSKLSGLAGLINNLPFGPIGAVYGLFNFFSGGGSVANEPTPLVFEGKISLTGSMTTEEVIGKLKVRIPGSIAPVADYWKPVYNKPLGVFNVQNMPKLKRTKYNQYHTKTYNNGTSSEIGTEWYSYKLTNDPQVILNPEANLSLQDSKVELIFTFRYPQELTSPPEDLLSIWADNGFITLNSGKKVIENNVAQGYLTFSTGLMSLSELQNTFINTPRFVEGQYYVDKVQYKMHLNLKRNDNPTAKPIVLVSTYAIDVEDVDNIQKGPFSFYLKATPSGNKVNLTWSHLFNEVVYARTFSILESVDGINWSTIASYNTPSYDFRNYAAQPSITGQYRYYKVRLKDNYGMDVYSQVRKIINPNYQPLFISISGPANLNFSQVGTFTANAVGGTSIYTYKWFYRNDGSGGGPIDFVALSDNDKKTKKNKDGGGISTDLAPIGSWFELLCYNSGGGSPIPCTNKLLFGYQTSFSIKCEVTDNSGSAVTAIHSVTVNGSNNISQLSGLEQFEGKVEQAEFIIPKNLIMESYPNPFNPTTTIRFGLPQSDFVSISIYNISGQLIEILHEGEMSAGFHNVSWNGNRVSSGVYFVMLKSTNNIIKQKIILSK